MFLVFDKILESWKYVEIKILLNFLTISCFQKSEVSSNCLLCSGTAVQLSMMYNSECVDLKTGREFPANIVITTLVVIS